MSDEFTPEEILARREEMMASATEADEDVEDMILRLESLRRRLREDPVVRARHDRLRDQLTEILTKHGPRYYLDEDGRKKYAYATIPEQVQLDVAEAIRLHQRGEIPTEVLNEIAPRTIDRKGLRAAITRGGNPRARKPGLSPKHVQQIVSITPMTGRVNFVDPDADDE